MRKKLVAGLAVVVLALAGLGGWYWWEVLRFRQSTDDAYVQSDVSVIRAAVNPPAAWMDAQSEGSD